MTSAIAAAIKLAQKVDVSELSRTSLPTFLFLKFIANPGVLPYILSVSKRTAKVPGPGLVEKFPGDEVARKLGVKVPPKIPFPSIKLKRAELLVEYPRRNSERAEF